MYQKFIENKERYGDLGEEIAFQLLQHIMLDDIDTFLSVRDIRKVGDTNFTHDFEVDHEPRGITTYDAKCDNGVNRYGNFFVEFRDNSKSTNEGWFPQYVRNHVIGVFTVNLPTHSVYYYRIKQMKQYIDTHDVSIGECHADDYEHISTGYKINVIDYSKEMICRRWKYKLVDGEYQFTEVVYMMDDNEFTEDDFV